MFLSMEKLRKFIFTEKMFREMKPTQLAQLILQSTVWKFRKFSPTAKIFRQIDLQYNSLVKKLI